MKRITMLQTLAGDREVFQKDKTYEITDPVQLEKFLKAGLCKLENDPEPTHQFDDQISDEDKKKRHTKVDKKLEEIKSK